MIWYEELRLKNRHLFKEASFDLGYKGISVILGLNKDANAGSTNAAGKSSLFSEIAELVVDESSLAGKAMKIENNGSVYLRVKKDKDTWEALRKNKNGRDALLLKKNGEDQDITRKGRARDILSKVIQRTPEEFFTLDCIDSQRPHPLHRGSTGMRRDFIISMFNLENVDNLRKVFASELRRIAEDRSRYEEIKRQYRSLSEQLVEESEEQLQEQVDRMERQYKKLSERTNKAADIANLFEFRRDNKKQIERLLEIAKREKLKDLADISEMIDWCEDKIKILNSQLSVAIKWSRYRERKAEYQKQIAKAKEKIGNISKEEAIKGGKRYEEIQQSLLKLEIQIKELKKDLPEKEKIDEDLKGYVSDPEALVVRINKNRAHIEQASQLLKLAKTLDDGKCPTCRQRVSGIDVKGIQKELSDRSKFVERLERNLRRIEAKRKYREIEVLEGKANEIGTLLDELRRFKRAHEYFTTMPDEPERPRDEDEGLTEEEVRERIEKVTRRLDFLRTMEPVVHKIKKCLELREEDEQEIKNLELLRQQLDKLVNTLPERRSALDRMKIVKREMEDLRERGKALKASVENEEAYKLLVEAYGNAGIKKLMLQRIGQHLENCFNRYSRYVFSESYKFRVRIDTQFDILVKRQYANRSLVSDVRKLSGAESRAFALLLWLSLLSLVPASRRSNILILDEPDANLGEEMRQNFVNFLPMLNKIVPHIIIITPHLHNYPDARVFTIVKEKGWSSIIKGKADGNLRSRIHN